MTKKLYPQKTQVLWNLDENGKPYNIHFVDIDDQSQEAHTIRKNCQCSLGADCADWYKQGPDGNYTGFDTITIALFDRGMDMKTTIEWFNSINSKVHTPTLTQKRQKDLIDLGYQQGTFTLGEYIDILLTLDLHSVSRNQVC
ncbi:MAG: hypothetical protein MRY79_06430 [Alphaproteobacteria bacterium]|nr:hypothetical protein [Alphaproteobacteria bacterium]